MADDFLDLVAPGGCDEANHGTERYRVDNDGRVRVPREAAEWLIRKGGFKVAPLDEAGASAKFTVIREPIFETTAPQTASGDGAEPSADLRRVPRRK